MSSNEGVNFARQIWVYIVYHFFFLYTSEVFYLLAYNVDIYIHDLDAKFSTFGRSTQQGVLDCGLLGDYSFHMIDALGTQLSEGLFFVINRL